MINALRKERKGILSVIALLLVISLMVMMTACGGGEAGTAADEGTQAPEQASENAADAEMDLETAFKAYVNSDGFNKMKELHMKFDDSYASVTYENYVDDATLVNEFSQNTMAITQELVDVANEVYSEVTNETIKGMQSNYIIFADNLNQSINRMLTATDMGDEAMKTEADNLMEDSNDAYYDYLMQLYELADEYGVTIEY